MNSASNENLEEKVAYLEAALDQLSDELFRQQKETAVLKKSYRELQEKLETMQEVLEQVEEAGNEKPPHY